MSRHPAIRLTIELDEAQMLRHGLPAVIDGIGVDSDGNVTLPPGDFSTWATPPRIVGTWERVEADAP